MRHIITIVFFLLIISSILFAFDGPDYGWYNEGDYVPEIRVKVVVSNTLGFDRTDCPVGITRDIMPIPNISDFFVTVVDPTLPPDPEPTEDEIRAVGGWKTRAETNGHYLFY